MLYRSRPLEICRKRGRLFAAVAFGVALKALATNAAPEPTAPGNPGQAVPPLIISGRQSVPGTYSAGTAELIKMLDAKLDSQVILAYIQNSPIPYNPDATELVALKDHGASTEMLLALLHHGDELRLQLAQAEGPINPPPAAPVYDFTTDSPYPTFLNPDSGEMPSPATYYSSVYSWPWLGRTSVCVNSYRPYRYERGCWHLDPGDRKHVGVEGDRHNGVIASAPPAPHSVSVPSAGHTSPVATRSNGSRGSGRSGGRSGGRSR